MPRKSTIAPSRALVPVRAPASARVSAAATPPKAKPPNAGGRRKGTPKTGGRKKGTPNKTSVAMKEAMLSVFADLQAEAGGGNGHFLGWAREKPTDFYRLASRLLPLQVTGESGGPVVTRIELVGVEPVARKGRGE